VTQLRELAERIVFSPSLADKLVPLGRWVDTDPGSGREVSMPARASSIAICTSGHTRHAFPALNVLARERACALHYFANHELLAVELMALALLRFPDAPPAFRRAIAATLRDEQIHVGLYLKRMEECGCTLGDYSLNGFFWKHISSMQSPLDYIARLSLTFEQANLDYARHYQQAFATIGDSVTASILERIYQDEIAHVRVGATWLDTWRDEGEDDWQTYQRGLSYPMTPARAKGIGFNREGRTKAGLSAGFIEHLRVYAHSKGRPATVWLFNPSCEEEAYGAAPSAGAMQLAADLAVLPAYLAAEDDVVLVPQAVELGFLNKLADCGICLPELVPAAPGALADRVTGDSTPWGWSPQADQQLLAVGARSPRAAPPVVHSKVWSCELRNTFQVGQENFDPLAALTRVCRSPAELEAAVMACEAAGVVGVVLKAPFGVAGRGNKFCELRNFPDRWLQRVWREQEAVILEAAVDVVCEFSALFKVHDRGARMLGYTRFGADDTGQYSWSAVTRSFDGIQADVRRFLSEGRLLHRTQRQLVKQVGAALAEQGFRGLAGIDSFVYRMGDALGLRGISEVNARATMGHVALALRKHVLPGVPANFAIQHAGAVKLQTPSTAERDGQVLLAHGAICLTPRRRETRFTAVLEVGDCYRRKGPGDF